MPDFPAVMREWAFHTDFFLFSLESLFLIEIYNRQVVFKDQELFICNRIQFIGFPLKIPFSYIGSSGILFVYVMEQGLVIYPIGM